jgi:hypothetical protein
LFEVVWLTLSPITAARCGVTRLRDPVEARRPAMRRRDQEAQRSRATA